MKYFITGTDTGVGKTVATILLSKYFLSKNKKVGVLKPIETGVFENNFPDYKIIAKAASDKEKELFLLSKPLAPYIAAKIDNVKIDIKKIIEFFSKDSKNYDIYFVEGAGGLFVPITENFLMIDLIKELNLEVILVARTNLGTVNHTLLSIKALQSKGIKIKDVIFNEVLKTPKNEILQNKEMIEMFSNVKIKNIFYNNGKHILDILENSKVDINWS